MGAGSLNCATAFAANWSSVSGGAAMVACADAPAAIGGNVGALTGVAPLTHVTAAPSGRHAM
ncbi:hypothetical protein D3C72_2144940 [compost metagenome]